MIYRLSNEIETNLKNERNLKQNILTIYGDDLIKKVERYENQLKNILNRYDYNKVYSSNKYYLLTLDIKSTVCSHISKDKGFHRIGNLEKRFEFEETYLSVINAVNDIRKVSTFNTKLIYPFGMLKNLGLATSEERRKFLTILKNKYDQNVPWLNRTGGKSPVYIALYIFDHYMAELRKKNNGYNNKAMDSGFANNDHITNNPDNQHSKV